jgi:hypothetical protein
MPEILDLLDLSIQQERSEPTQEAVDVGRFNQAVPSTISISSSVKP